MQVSNKKGEMAKLLVWYDLLKQGFEVTRSNGMFDGYDYLIKYEDRYFRVKVKTYCNLKDGRYGTVHIPKNQNFDIFAIVDIDNDLISYTIKQA